MDFWQIGKKFKEKFIVVEPGRAVIPHLAEWQTHTGVSDGSYVVTIGMWPGAGSVFDFFDDEGNIQIRQKSGLTMPYATQENDPLSLSERLSESAADDVNLRIPGKKLMGWLESAASRDEYRGVLNGVFISNNGCRMSSTDGHRLHDAKLFESLVSSANDLPNIVFPRDFLKILEKAKRWTANEFRSILDMGDGLLVRAPHPEGVFPAIDQVIPKDLSHHDALPSQEIFKAFEAAHKVLKPLKEKNLGVAIDRPSRDEIQLRISKQGLAWSHPVISTTRTGKDAPTPVGVNPQYMTDALKDSTETVALAYFDKLGPLLLGLSPLDDAQRRRAIVMPLRL